MSELLKEYENKKVLRSFKTLIIGIVAVIGVVIVGIYYGNLMFGDRSVWVLLTLDDKVEYLKKDIDRLKQINAKLQKEYFELKELEPDDAKK